MLKKLFDLLWIFALLILSPACFALMIAMFFGGVKETFRDISKNSDYRRGYKKGYKKGYRNGFEDSDDYFY